MPTIAEQLSSYATSLHYQDLPPEVVHQAKRLIIDTLGCALGGYASVPSSIAREHRPRGGSYGDQYAARDRTGQQ